jgi:hypothetical protein
LIDPDGQWTLPVQKPLQPDAKLPLEIPQVVVGRDRLRALVHDTKLQVVLQVLADAGQVVQYRDAEFLQKSRRPDAGKLQQLRALDCAGAQDDFTSCLELPVADLQADCPFPLKKNPCCLAIGLDPHVLASLG